MQQNIPHELKEYDHWVLHNAPEDKKPRQVDGSMALADAPSTWTSFDAAAEAVDEGRFTGLGFEFSHHTKMICFDLDHCMQDGVIIDEQTARLVELLDSYTEISPSGDGLHVIINAEYPRINRKFKGVEVWNSGKYCTITGNVYGGRKKLRTDVRNEAAALIDELVKKANKPTPLHTAGEHSEIDVVVDFEAQINITQNPDLIDGMVSVHPKFAAIWTGTGDYADASSADLALANILCDAGLTDQEVANWIGARRINVGAPQDKEQRLDYLQRTIATATRDRPMRELKQRRREAQETVARAELMPENDEAREEVRQAFSTMLGCDMQYLVQQSIKGSKWYIKFTDGAYLPIGETSALRNRNRWIDLMIEHNNAPPAVPTGRGAEADWHDMLRGVLRHLVKKNDDTDDTMETRLINMLQHEIEKMTSDDGTLRETPESMLKSEAITVWHGKIRINGSKLAAEWMPLFKGNKEFGSATLRTAAYDLGFKTDSLKLAPGDKGNTRVWIKEVD